MSLSQTEQIYARLRRAVLALDLAPGERMTERGLEAGFQASRTPVRAALVRLESEGLARRSGRGWIVAPIDLTEIAELAELREAVEAAAVRLTVARAADGDIAAFARSHSRPPATDAEEGVQAGGDFHAELARLSGNRLMAEAVRGAMTRLARTRLLDVRTPEARHQAAREHREIAEAVLSRDAEGAASLIADHIRRTNERLLLFLDADRGRFRGHGYAVDRPGARGAAIP